MPVNRRSPKSKKSPRRSPKKTSRTRRSASPKKKINMRKLKRIQASISSNKSVYNMPVDDATYKALVVKRQNKVRMTKKENKQLDEALHMKLCGCISKQVAKNIDNPKAIAPYPLCMNAVYKKRKFDVPSKAVQQCTKYSWYI